MTNLDVPNVFDLFVKIIELLVDGFSFTIYNLLADPAYQTEKTLMHSI